MSSISLMLDLTLTQSAGTFIGAWGLAQSLAKAIATLSGGVILDIGKQIFSLPLLAYGLVFTIQAIFMLIAIPILKRVDLAEFRGNQQEAVTMVMEGDLDG